MEELITLASNQYISSPSFINPNSASEPAHPSVDHFMDHTVMYQLLDELKQLAHVASMRTVPSASIISCAPTLTGWTRRLMLLRPLELLQCESIFLVGFFGQKNLNIDPRLHEQLAQADNMLVEEMDRNPYLLSYCTTLLADGVNYANVVLFSHKDGVTHWTENGVHQRVVAEMAPVCYSMIHLYNGTWHLPAHELHLTCLKQFDYRSQPYRRTVQPLAS